MPKILLLFVAICVTVAAALFLNTRSPRDPLPALIDAFRTAHSLPGGVIAYGPRGGQPSVYGLGDADPGARTSMDANARLHIASLTKPLTAAAVLSLAEAGVIALDTPLAAQMDLPPPFDPRALDITPRHILSHRAGFDWRASFDPVFAPERVGGTPDMPCPALARLTWASRPLDHAPDTSEHYANIGYCLLSELLAAKDHDLYQSVAQVAPGVNFGAIAQPHWLFDGAKWLPLAATDTLRSDPSLLAGAGGANSTAAAYWRFAVQSHMAQTSAAPEGADGSYYALGWRVWPGPQGPHLTHFGHLPGIFSAVFVLSDGFTLVALFNGGVQDGVRAFSELFDAVCFLRELTCRPS